MYIFILKSTCSDLYLRQLSRSETKKLTLKLKARLVQWLLLPWGVSWSPRESNLNLARKRQRMKDRPIQCREYSSEAPTPLPGSWNPFKSPQKYGLEIILSLAIEKQRMRQLSPWEFMITPLRAALEFRCLCYWRILTSCKPRNPHQGFLGWQPLEEFQIQKKYISTIQATLDWQKVLMNSSLHSKSVKRIQERPPGRH